MLYDYLKDGNISYALVLLNTTAPLDEDDLRRSLSYACFKDYYDVSLAILRRANRDKIDLKTNKPEVAGSPLLSAIEEANVRILEVLIDHGFDINEFLSGRTALHHAVSTACDVEQQIGRPMSASDNFLKVIRLLIERGADPNALDYQERKAIEIAKLLKSSIVCSVLSEKGVAQATAIERERAILERKCAADDA
jgi:ankyrin repeat protein